MQNLYNLSERNVCVNVDCNIIYRYFVGLGITEEVPHWTDLGKFKERIGVKAFERLFYRVLEKAEKLDIEISDKRNADATHLETNVDISRCAKDKQDENDHGWIDRNTTDPEAGFGLRVIPRDNMKQEREKKKRNNHYLHLKKQRHRVERKFAEGKKHHGLGKAKYWGRWKVHLQNLLIYLTMNLKRIVNVLIPKFA